MEEKEKGEKNYKLIYKIIQNEIKDYIINKFISIIKNQNEIIKEIKKSNEILKKNYLFILKKILLKEEKKKSNHSLSKNTLNTSFKLTDFSKNAENENISFINNIEKKALKNYKKIMNKKNISSSFILKKNIPLNEEIFPKYFHRKKNSLLEEKEINQSLQINNSQKLISTSNKNSFHNDNEKKKIYKHKGERNFNNLNNEISKKSIINEQKIFDYKKKNKNNYNHRSSFLTNKL